jgi:hypothetical protein
VLPVVKLQPRLVLLLLLDMVAVGREGGSRLQAGLSGVGNLVYCKIKLFNLGSSRLTGDSHGQRAAPYPASFAGVCSASIGRPNEGHKVAFIFFV